MLAIDCLLEADEETILAVMYKNRANRALLAQIQERFGINECPYDCIPPRKPCAKHSLWAKWRAAGASILEVATLWEEQCGCIVTGRRIREACERVLDVDHCHYAELVAEVRKACRRRDPANCDCWASYGLCVHVVERPYYLPLRAQALLLSLLHAGEPDGYEEPRLDDQPSMVHVVSLQAAVMARRADRNLHPEHPDDLIRRSVVAAFQEWTGRDVVNGANGHALAGRLKMRKS